MWISLTRAAVVLSVVLGSSTSLAHDFSNVIAKVISSVCRVETTAGVLVVDSIGPRIQQNPFDKFLKPLPKAVPQQAPGGMGSCFVVSVNNTKYLITNEHVAYSNDGKNTAISISFHNDPKRHSAEVVGADKISDIAVLEMTTALGQKKLKSVPALSWADSDKAVPGQEIFAIGHPMGQEWTVTQGIISATKKRSMNTWQEVIQSDVSINQGNSGGPMFNTKGKVVGVNAFIFATNGGGSIGLNFSITSNGAVSIVKELILTGKIRRGKIGVSFGIDPDLGRVVVNAIEQDGPMDKAGFKAGDILERINGFDIIFPRHIGKSMDGVKPNEDIDIQVLRDGVIVLNSVTTGEYVYMPPS
jgi:serine protease Do